jgi:hypothetical protein
MIARIGPAGQELGDRALQFQLDIKASLDSLIQISLNSEQTIRSVLDSKTAEAPSKTNLNAIQYFANEECLKTADSVVSEIKRMLMLIAIASCKVEIGTSKEKLLEGRSDKLLITS